MEEPFLFYNRKSEKYVIKIKTVSNSLKRFAWYRLAAFLLIFVPFLIPSIESSVSFPVAFLILVTFLSLVRKNILLEREKHKFEILKKIVDDELLALKHRFEHFDGGKDFADNNHFFSCDLDIFGEGSLFQFINRTATLSGRHKLADLFKNPPLQKEIITCRQEAVRELSKIPNWRLHFLARGLMFKETEELNEEIKSWSNTDPEPFKPGLIKLLIIVMPAVTLLSVIPAIYTGSWTILAIPVLIQWFILFLWRKNISFYYNFFGKKSELLSKYMDLLRFIEEREFHASKLAELQRAVKIPGSAWDIFRQLKRHVSEFEFRQNLIVNILLNSVLLWDLRCLNKLWTWHRKNRQRLPVWLNVIAETDALISLAGLAYDRPDFNFPVIHDGGFSFVAEKMGHPLIMPGKRVDNDINISGWSKVLIITGANMAGKSTFLRTAGVNMILACTGAPVCARKMTVTPVGVYTDMRTTDSLMKDESYFFAELKRIKRVLDRLSEGERFLVILDEMLKGTNSADKLNGSKDLIRRFIEYRAVALIATHDLKLSETEDEFPGQVINKCFEITINGDEMVFDYLLKDGVTKMMNASYLMKKMGII